MVSGISGPPSNGVTTTEQRRMAAPTPAETGQPGHAAAAGGAPGEQVVLTDTAARLQAAERIIAETPEVDRQRIDQLRQSIADGSYQVDAGRTADKLLQFESQLPLKDQA